MSIFQTAYDTSVATGYNIKSIMIDVEKALTIGQAIPIYEDIFALISGNTQVFPHPVYLPSKKTVIDVRQYNSPNIDNELQIRVRDKAEYDLLVNRAKLTKVWLESDPKVLSFIHPKLMAIYAEWISGCIAKRFALDYKDQVTIKALCALYYLSLFDSPNDWDNHYTANALLKVNQILKISTVIAKEILMDIEKPLTTIHSLTDIIKEKTENVRLQGLNPGILLTLISSTWFGNNHSETLAVSLEHPPTFIALVYSAINETLYKRVGFTQVVQNVLKGESRNLSTRVYELLS